MHYLKTNRTPLNINILFVKITGFAGSRAHIATTIVEYTDERFDRKIRKATVKYIIWGSIKNIKMRENGRGQGWRNSGIMGCIASRFRMKCSIGISGRIKKGCGS